MPNLSSDNLFLLIKSMNKVEKRHFRLYTSRNRGSEGAKFIKLFEVLDGMKEYNEEQILKKARSIKRSQLANLKAHLYGELLVALRLLHSDRNLDIQIREQIDYAKILYNRGLILQSLKVLDKAKTLAKENGHYLLTLEILQFEKSIESRHITRSLKGRAANLIEETVYYGNKITEVVKLSNLSLMLYGVYLDTGHVKNEKEASEVEELFKKHLEGINTRQSNFFGKAYLHQAYCWYYFILYDFSRYYRHAEKWVRLFEEHPEEKKEDPFLYLKAVHNLLNALFIIGNDKKMDEELKYLEDFYNETESWNENLRIQGFVYLYTAKINKHFLEGTFTKGLELIPEIENELKKYQAYLDTHRIMVFYYKIASLYFGSGDNENAIRYLNKIINLKVGHLRTDIQCFARILHLIAHYELGNTDILEYLIKSVYRFLSKMEDTDAVQDEIFRFLRKSLSSRQQDLTKQFIELRDRLEKVSEDKYARRSYQYLDIISWLESKIERKPVQAVIRRKFLERKGG